MRPVTNETFVRVLYRLRAEIVREGQDGLEHVDALLRLRGADPEAQTIPARVPKSFGRGKLRMAVLRALRDGPRTSAQVAAAVAAEHGMTAEQVRTVYPCLSRMLASGAITAARKGKRGRCLWSVA